MLQQRAGKEGICKAVLKILKIGKVSLKKRASDGNFKTSLPAKQYKEKKHN